MKSDGEEVGIFGRDKSGLQGGLSVTAAAYQEYQTDEKGAHVIFFLWPFQQKRETKKP
jgi:hypothetical protein